MTRKTYTAEEQASLRNNQNVVRCSDRSITYSVDFKRTALRAYYEEGKSPRVIFAEAGFPDTITETDTPRQSLRQWRRTYGSDHEHADLSDKRGVSKNSGRPRKEQVNLSAMTDKEKLEYYEAKVMYQEAENDFLAKARGLKRWQAFVWRPGSDSH